MSKPKTSWKVVGSYAPRLEMKKGESRVLEVGRHFWAGKPGDMWPATEAADVTNGELFCLRVDKAYLRVIGRIPAGTPFQITYRGKGKKVGKNNAPDLYTIAVEDTNKLTSLEWCMDNPAPEVKPVKKTRIDKRGKQ